MFNLCFNVLLHLVVEVIYPHLPCFPLQSTGLFVLLVSASVVHVVLRITPFKILKSVIILLLVDVVDLREVVWIGYKRLSNKTMYIAGLLVKYHELITFLAIQL